MVFQTQPTSGLWRFRSLPKQVRDKVRFDFVMGGQSDVSNPHSERWLRMIFSRMRFNAVRPGTHMFPMNQMDETVKLVAELLS